MDLFLVLSTLVYATVSSFVDIELAIITTPFYIIGMLFLMDDDTDKPDETVKDFIFRFGKYCSKIINKILDFLLTLTVLLTLVIPSYTSWNRLKKVLEFIGYPVMISKVYFDKQKKTCANTIFNVGIAFLVLLWPTLFFLNNFFITVLLMLAFLDFLVYASGIDKTTEQLIYQPFDPK